MTLTEELRKCLDECGVKWWEDSFDSKHRTLFDGANGVRYCVYQLGDSLFIDSVLPIKTPEQAIAATVGVGTCEDNGFIGDGGWYFTCSKCGCEFEYTDFACEFAEGCGLGRPNFCPNCGKRIEES